MVRRSARISGFGFDRAGQYAAEMARRFHLTLFLSMLIGVLTGLGVAAFDKAVQPMINNAIRQGCIIPRSP